VRRGERVEEVTALRADSLYWPRRLSKLPVVDEGGGTTDILLALMGYKFGWRRMQVICLLVALAGILIIALPFAVQGITQEGWREFFSNQSLVGVLLPGGITGLLLIPHVRRHAQLYDAAFSSPMGNVPWAANQPMHDKSALTLPTIIRLRIRWPAALIWHVLVLVVAMGVASGFTVGGMLLRNRLTGEPLDSQFLLISMTVVIGLICILAVATAVLFLPVRLQTLHIVEEGVAQTQDRLGRVSAVTWEKARVFALVGGGRHPGSAATYMLSSGARAVRWTRRSRTRWYSITAPTTSDDDYQRQMDALLSYIAARTGLPLLALR
jgi:hypothetical protein